MNSTSKATHICLDPTDSSNDWLRDGRPGQHIVTLKWVEDSFLDRQTKDERRYALGGGGTGGGAAESSTSGRMEVDVDRRARQRDRPAVEEDETDQLADDTSGSDEEYEERSSNRNQPMDEEVDEDFEERNNNG